MESTSRSVASTYCTARTCLGILASSSILALAPCNSRLPDRQRARSLGSLWMKSQRLSVARQVSGNGETPGRRTRGYRGDAHADFGLRLLSLASQCSDHGPHGKLPT